MFEAIVERLLGIAFSGRRSLSSKEKTALSELKTAFRELRVVETREALASEVAWLRNMTRLRALVLNRDPRRFLRWPVISDTMFIAFARYISIELKYLKQRADWRTRWRSAIHESSVGRPIPYLFYPSSSANLIHHAYHVAQFENETNIPVDTMAYVVEFGGGYGSMCRLFYNLGFHGTYVIFDLPAVAALQRYYLDSLGAPVLTGTQVTKAGAGIVCLSDMRALREVVTDRVKAGRAMFIATWSLSEAPIHIREAVLSLTNEFEAFLISYQDGFGEVNNSEFFSNWKEGMKTIRWHSWRINHIPGSTYLVGSVPVEG